MQKFQQHTVYQNQNYLVPTFSIKQQLENQQSKLLGFLISDQDFESPSEQLASLKNNEALKNHIKKTGIYTGFGLQQAEKYVIFYTKDHQDQSKGFKEGRKIQKNILSEFSENNQVADIVFSNHFTQEFLNEFIYGMVIENYLWQCKSHKEEGISTNKTLNVPIKSYNFTHDKFDLNNSQFKELMTIARAKLYSRQLSNTRANEANTVYMYEEAKALQQKNQEKVDLFVLKGQEIKDAGMNLMYAVGQGAVDESYLVCLHYKGDPQNKNKTISLVGKGVVFDSGGMSIKKAGMERMFGDKGGACSVLGIFQGIVELGLEINVVCTLALVENCISSNSYRVSDIYQTLKGITVEIINTDAEGRNILVDAMTFTQRKYNPQVLIDMATLTGACPQALGQTSQGLFTNDYDKAQQMQKYSQQHQEDVWHLPITEYMRNNIVSDQADIRNAGKQPYGGSGTAAAMLEKFIEEGVEWYHFDIAPSNQLKGEGQPIRTIINYIKDQYIQ